MESISIKLKRVNDLFNDIPLPEYATEGSSGLDLRAAVEKSIVIEKGNFMLIPTNISIELPAGYEFQVRPRSGLAVKHGIGVLNSPGTIDADYRGEIKVILFNFGKNDFSINRGDRIAQMVLSKVIKAEFAETESLADSKRGAGGFGHTGNS